MRSDARYFADIRTAIREFYQPGDELRLVRHYIEHRKCEMCGDMVDIRNCYELRNTRSGKVIVCGAKCIARYAEVISQMGQTPAIVFLHHYRKNAEKVNQHRKNTVVVEPEPKPEWSNTWWSPDDLIGQRPGVDDPTYADAISDGLDPDEFDWESHDYE